MEKHIKESDLYTGDFPEGSGSFCQITILACVIIQDFLQYEGLCLKNKNLS